MSILVKPELPDFQPLKDLLSKKVSGDIIVHPKASWTSLIWALYQADNAKDY